MRVSERRETTVLPSPKDACQIPFDQELVRDGAARPSLQQRPRTKSDWS